MTEVVTTKIFFPINRTTKKVIFQSEKFNQLSTHARQAEFSVQHSAFQTVSLSKILTGLV
jgi:hypothetical protein